MYLKHLGDLQGEIIESTNSERYKRRTEAQIEPVEKKPRQNRQNIIGMVGCRRQRQTRESPPRLNMNIHPVRFVLFC